jgi:hypothetical protein
MLNNPSAIEHVIKVIDHGLTLMWADGEKYFMPNRMDFFNLIIPCGVLQGFYCHWE